MCSLPCCACTQEAAAREAVVLPYEHQGQGKVYQSGDARAYLPPAAGGIGPGSSSSGSIFLNNSSSSGSGSTARGAGAAAGGRGGGGEGGDAAAGRLGHILYVRDSEEEHDSDEDPDDDIDL